MTVKKGKKGTRLGGKKKQQNREQKADVETHVEVNNDGIYMFYVSVLDIVCLIGSLFFW
jgi:hypothetical protein